jgi:hypothetical protein
MPRTAMHSSLTENNNFFETEQVEEKLMCGA